MPNILLITKGHPFDREAFFSMFDADPELSWTHVEQPAAQVFFDPELAAPYDAFVLYDMPGIEFHPEPGRAPDFVPPPPKMVSGFRRLLDGGKGLVFLHHALAGWPAWPEYADVLGGRFLYLPGEVRGRRCLDSGYRHNVTYRVRTVADHPVLEGIPCQFEITDELYLAEMFEDEVTPLLRADHTFCAENFHSAARAVVDNEMYSNRDWPHPPGSNLIAWVKSAGASPIVYLQPGDGPSAYENPHYRRLLGNAIRWVASAEAREWARSRLDTADTAEAGQ